MPMEQVQRVRAATVAILGLVLFTGFLLGAAWDRRLGAEPPVVMAADTAAAPAQRQGQRRPMYYLVQPPLTREQLTQAEGITAHRRQLAQALFEEPYIDSLYDEMKGAEQAFRDAYDPRFRELVDSSRAAIKRLMSPEQVTYYDSLLAESDRRRREEARREGSDR